MYKIKEFENFPVTKQVIERLFTIVGGHFHPRISYSFIKTWLNDIAQKVLIQLEKKHPAHSIFSTSFEQFSAWRENNISDVFWDRTETAQIMCVLEKVLSEFIDRELYKLLLSLDLKIATVECVSYCKLCSILIIHYSLFICKYCSNASLYIVNVTTIKFNECNHIF